MYDLLVARIPVVLAFAIICYFCVLAVYRLTLHPLAKYPGPLWASVTSWPEAISAWKLCRHTDLDRLHEQYGDIVRYSPNKLSFRSAQAWNDIYTDRNANVIKTGFTDTVMKVNKIINTHSIADRDLHSKRRKLLNHAFSESTLRNLEPQILQRIREWYGFLAQPAPSDVSKIQDKPTKQWSMKRDMGQWSSYLTTDVLSQVCFSQDNGACKNAGSSVSGWDEDIPGTMEFVSRMYTLPIREWLYPFIGKDNLAAVNPFPGALANSKFKASATKCVTQRFALEETEKNHSDAQRTKDFFYCLLSGNNPETGTKFDPMELVGEALLLVIAGSDTSSTAMSATFFYLLNNNRVLEKLKQEVRGAFEDVEEIKYYGSKLKDLVYLRACIDEAMRLSPPVPTLLDRLVLPGGAEIDGTFVPEGISVGVPIYTLHHNPRYFEKPHLYIPERWIEGSTPSETGFRSVVTEEQIEHARSAWVPFSTGLRGCVGKSLAYMELTMALARAIFLFDIRSAPSQGILLQSRDLGNPLDRASGTRRENKEEYQLNDVFVAQRVGPVVEFKSV